MSDVRQSNQAKAPVKTRLATSHTPKRLVNMENNHVAKHGLFGVTDHKESVQNDAEAAQKSN